MTLTRRVARRTAYDIAADNAARVEYTAKQKPIFPEVRDLFSSTGMIASFSHPAPDPIARELFGNMVLFETAVMAGLVDRPLTRDTASIETTRVMNLAYDFGVPAHRDNWHAPGYNRIAMGDFPEVISPNLPYFTQRLKKKIDGRTLAAITSRVFGNDAEAEARAREVVGPFVPLAFEGKKGVLEALPVLLQVRENVFMHMDIDHIRESSAFALSSRIADALQTLEEKFGLPFYRMPLGDQFESGGHLRALDSIRMRRPVDVKIGEHGIPTFTFRDPETKEVSVAHGLEIYDLLRDGKVIPTVPTFLLATVIGPQIPQMGGRDWKKYAPALLEEIARWAGLESRDVPALYLCTEGYDPFRVYFKGSTNPSKHFTMSYVTFGKEAMAHALRSDETLVGRYGREGIAIRELVVARQ